MAQATRSAPAIAGALSPRHEPTGGRADFRSDDSHGGALWHVADATQDCVWRSCSVRTLGGRLRAVYWLISSMRRGFVEVALSLAADDIEAPEA